MNAIESLKHDVTLAKFRLEALKSDPNVILQSRGEIMAMRLGALKYQLSILREEGMRVVA